MADSRLVAGRPVATRGCTIKHGMRFETCNADVVYCIVLSRGRFMWARLPAVLTYALANVTLLWKERLSLICTRIVLNIAVNRAFTTQKWFSCCSPKKGTCRSVSHADKGIRLCQPTPSQYLRGGSDMFKRKRGGTKVSTFFGLSHLCACAVGTARVCWLGPVRVRM